ncbi:MAG TPA: hypothetical protein VF791_12655 [Pyrinomonadaceae bacterium]
MQIKRRFLIFSLLLLTFIGSAEQPGSAATLDALPRVNIVKRRTVIVRKGKVARDFPERKRAVVSYPVINGPKNSEVLNKIRAALDFPNIFGSSLKEYQEDAWLTDFDYKVNYNQNYILDLTFTQSGVGAYPDTQTKHFAFNLRNGELLKASDVFNADGLDMLAYRVNEILQVEIKKIIMDNPEIKGDAEQMFGALEFKVGNLDDFAVSAKGLTFLYDAEFPHAIRAVQPGGRYYFPYAQIRNYIKRDGPLGVFVR